MGSIETNRHKKGLSFFRIRTGAPVGLVGLNLIDRPARSLVILK